MTNRQLKHFEGLLIVERSRLQEILANIAVAARVADEDGTLHFIDREPPAAALGMSEADDAAVEARALASLEEVDRSLSLLQANPKAYGVCERCGRAIPLNRLEIVPATRRCERHAGVP